MKAFDSLDEMYADLSRVAGLKLRGAGSLGVRLSAHRDSVFLARQLTRIACDLRLGVAAGGLRRRPPDLPALSTLYDRLGFGQRRQRGRSEEHTSELQSPYDLVCRLLLEKKNKDNKIRVSKI